MHGILPEGFIGIGKIIETRQKKNIDVRNNLPDLFCQLQS